MYKNRLLILAKYLATLPEKGFDLRYWQRDAPCGTTACAIGHGATIPELRHLGLGLELASRYGPNNEYTLYRPTYQPRNGKKLVGSDAVLAFFGLTLLEACKLFGVFHNDIQNASPLRVACRIRAFIEHQAAQRVLTQTKTKVKSRMAKKRKAIRSRTAKAK